MPLMATNRIGLERSKQDPEKLHIRFYGSSFICDASGAKVAEAGSDAVEIITANFDLDALQKQRRGWFVFRDRRPELYSALGSFATPSQKQP
jgi:N-carbamoylputrescine amidase